MSDTDDIASLRAELARHRYFERNREITGPMGVWPDQLERVLDAVDKLRAYAPDPFDDSLPTYATMVQDLAETEQELDRALADVEVLKSAAKSWQRLATNSGLISDRLHMADLEIERLRADVDRLRRVRDAIITIVDEPYVLMADGIISTFVTFNESPEGIALLRALDAAKDPNQGKD